VVRRTVVAVNGEYNVIPPVGVGREPVTAKSVTGRGRPGKKDVLEISGDTRPPSGGGQEGLGHGLGARRMEAGAAKTRNELCERINSGFYESEEAMTYIAARILGLLGL
jgi:hypothetical protein